MYIVISNPYFDLINFELILVFVSLHIFVIAYNTVVCFQDLRDIFKLIFKIVFTKFKNGSNILMG